MRDATEIEAALDRAAAEENFPVGSLLLPAECRPHIAVFYRFARTADDIADDPALPAQEKRAHLDRLRAALLGKDPEPALDVAHRMRRSLDETGVTARHCLDLLAAFRQDTAKTRYARWDELLDYCDRSAAPVGRYLIDLHGESATLYEPSDALCNALQILNHLQDCSTDYRRLGRVYIPSRFFDEAGVGVEALAERHSGPGLRRVFDRTLDAVDLLLRDASALPRSVRNRRLALEASVILAIAERLSAALRSRDPLARRVRLGRGAYAACFAKGIWRGLSARRGGAAAVAPRADVRSLVARSGTSFYWAMRLLPRQQREAMFAIYAFCRSVDDVADGDLPTVEKRRLLSGWRAELDRVIDGTPQTAVGMALASARTRYSLRREDLEAIVDGVEMDVSGETRVPDTATLELYCARVAGAVGLLSMAVFGEHSADARRGALALGQAMQLTNILRDVAEDAARDRLYLPREILQRHGVAAGRPLEIIEDPGFAEACAALAALAESRFAEADRALGACPGRRLWPARAMMAIYRLLLHRLTERGWARLSERPEVGPARKLWITLRTKLA